MQAARVKLLRYPPPPVLTPQLTTAASAISTRLYAFDLGSYVARLVEAGVQRYGEPLDPYLGALFTAASGRRAVFRPMGEKHLDGLFEALTQGGDWSIRTTNYIEFEPHPNQHVVDRRCVEERLRALLTWDLSQSPLTPTAPQALHPRLLKLVSLGLMEYRDGAVAPTQTLLSLAATLI
jgi:hypothetical protein